MFSNKNVGNWELDVQSVSIGEFMSNRSFSEQQYYMMGYHSVLIFFTLSLKKHCKNSLVGCFTVL